jgi:geranylgeranyl diphosphate synthase type I
VDKIGEFGKIFGMAFQVQDDYLGIWGDPTLTGKSQFTDLLSRKKTYPILQGLTGNNHFSKLWKTSDEIDEELAMKLSTYLEQEGFMQQVIQTYSGLYDDAWEVLHSIGLNSKTTSALNNLLNSIRQRSS